MFAVQRATLQPRRSEMKPYQLHGVFWCAGGDGTGAYFTGGDIPGIPDCQGRWVEGGEEGRGEGVREGEGEVRGSQAVVI